MTDTYRIKALCWEQDGDIHDARTPFGCLRIIGPFHGGNFRARFEQDSRSEWIGGKHDSLDDAKAACEQHWHDTIKQALEEV